MSLYPIGQKVDFVLPELTMHLFNILYMESCKYSIKPRTYLSGVVFGMGAYLKGA